MEQMQQSTQTTKPATVQKVAPQLASTFVFVAEIHSAKTSTGKEYKYIIDAETKERWNLFNNERVEVNKAYTFSYELNGTYKNIKSIVACTNVFKQEAAKELANKNDIKKDLFMSLSYAKDLASNGVLDMTQITNKATEFYNFVNSEADKLYNATQSKEVK